MKSYYELLEVAPTASPDEIKHAFRRAIGKYHPDKVQHLGVEFLDVAAARTAEITQAYRALSNPLTRSDHDARVAPAVEPSQGGGGFQAERAEASALVRQAALRRFREALRQEFGPCEETPAHGFEVVAITPKREGWTRRSQVRVLGRLVARVDAAVVQDSWARARRLEGDGRLVGCVFLLGQAVASAEDLGPVIDDLQRRPARTGGDLTLVPIDIRTWSACVPTNAPPVVKAILQRLRAA